MHLPDPVFPPLLTGHAVKAPEQAFASAVRGAARRQLRAGDIVWSRNADRLDCAIVLEPEVPREQAVEMMFVTLVAFGDCFGALSPPEIALTFAWPTTIRVNGGRAGEARIAMAAERGDDGAPRWMVAGVEVDLRAKGERAKAPGLFPDLTTLYDEGCGDITRTQLVESFSRHLLSWIHLWETEGFREVHDSLLYRLDGHREEVVVELGGARHEGRFTGLDEHGNMLLEGPLGIRIVEAMDAVQIVDTAEAAP
jgi:BirA family transcriptional regulator, biotin operon repressor / biotin---[acetyl-CoA-carboxylase] ligase